MEETKVVEKKSFFKIKERNSKISTEIIAGIITFLAMCYIIPVNTGMINNGGAGIEIGVPYGAAFLATVLSAALASIIMGLVANYPVGLAAGMGCNAFFFWTVIMGMGLSWKAALLCVFISGILFLIITLTGLRKKIIDAIPQNLRYAVGAGIGLFIAFIGLKNCGIIVADTSTGVTLGNLSSPTVLLGVFGIFLVVILFTINKKVSRFAVIISIVATCAIGAILSIWFKGMPAIQKNNDYGTMFKEFGDSFASFFRDGSCWKEVFTKPAGYIAIFTFLFMDFFDTAGTLMAVGSEAGLMDENGNLKGDGNALLADSIGTIAGAMLGTSTVTSFVESGTGVAAGGRTGLTAVVVGVLFLLSILLYPVLGLITSSCTSMALVFVGILMILQLKNIDWSDMAFAIPTFMTMIFMVLSYSISVGIAVGFIFYPICKLCQGKAKDVHPIMWGLLGFFVLYFVTCALRSMGLFDVETAEIILISVKNMLIK